MKTLIAAAALLISSVGAQADQLPKDMLGVWCFSSEHQAYWPNDVKPCDKDSDGRLIMKQNGYDAHEEKCRFTAIKQTGRYTAAHTKPSWPDGWTPVMSVVAQCSGEGDKWIKRFEFSLDKSTILTIREEKGLDKDTILAIERKKK
jgi:hypothetical protein